MKNSTSHNGQPPATPDCVPFTDLLPLVAHNLLAAEDAERVQTHLATCPHCQAQLAAYDQLDALLRAQAHNLAPMAPSVEETMEHIEDQQNPLPPVEHAPTSMQPLPRPSRKLTAVGALAALLLIGLLVQAFLGHLPPAQKAGNSVHPDATATFDPSVGENWLPSNVFPPVAQYPTPQEAFAAAGPASMCKHSTTLDQAETWLAASSTFGLLLVQAHCSDGRAPVAWVTVERTPESAGTCAAWTFNSSSYFISRPLPGEVIPPDLLAQVPSWLALPVDSYENASTGEDNQNGGLMRFGATIWISATRIFVVTRFQGVAIRPSGAVTISLGGHAGWYLSQDGMTTVTVPLDGRESYTFVGSGDIAAILPLATAALTNLNSLQPRMYDPGHSTVLDCH